MKIVCEIKVDEKDPKKCGQDCPMYNDFAIAECALSNLELGLNEDGHELRCQPCLDAEREYNKLKEEQCQSS